MASKTIMRMMAPLLDWAAPRYQAAVGDVLKKHGLRYEDLYDPLLNQACFSWTVSLLPGDDQYALTTRRLQAVRRSSCLACLRIELPMCDGA